MLAVGDGRAEDPVGPAPDELAGEGVQRVGAAVAGPRRARCVATAARTGGEVDEPVDDARCPVDGGRGLEPPEPVAGSGVEGHELSVVGADVHALAPDGRPRVDVVPGPLRPQQPAAGRAERVERPVRVPDEDPAVRDRRRGVEELPAAEAGERLCPPLDPACPSVERVEAASVGSEVDLSVRERRRAVDLCVGGEPPAGLARVDVDRVELVVPRPCVERLADDERRRLEDAGPVPPDDLPRPGSHGDDHPRLASRVPVARQRLHPGVVDDAVRHRRRGGRTVVEAALPDDLPGPVVEGVEAASLVRDVEPAVRDRRRELEDMAGLERPPEAERRAQLEVGRGVCALDAQAVRGPREPQDDAPRPRSLRRLRLLGRDELLGRRAALVVDRAFLVEVDAGKESGDDRRDGDPGKGEESVPVHGLRTTTVAESRRSNTSTTSA